MEVGAGGQPATRVAEGWAHLWYVPSQRHAYVVIPAKRSVWIHI